MNSPASDNELPDTPRPPHEPGLAADSEVPRDREDLEEMVKRRTAELHSANRKLTDTMFALESVGTAITWADIETGRLLFANRHAAEMLGYTQGELCELTVPDIDPNFSPENYSLVIREIRDQGFLRFDTTQRHKDGHLIPVEMTVYYQAGEADSPARYIAFGVDITTRKQAELDLRESEQRYRELSAALEQKVRERTAEVRAANDAIREREESLKFVLEGSRLGTWDWNIETGEVKRNDYWAEMLGYTRQEVDDATTDGWLELIHPDDRTQVWQSVADHLAGRTPLHVIEYRMRARDGGYRWILDRARVVSRDRAGRALRMSGTHEDITDRKLAEAALRDSEERFRLAFDNANAGMCLLDLQGHFMQVNEKMSAIFGYSRHELEAMSFNDLTHPDDLALSAEFIRHALQGTSDSATFEKRYRHRQGQIVHGQVAFSLVRDPQGQPKYFITQVIDVTERRQMQERLQLSEARYRLALDAANEGLWDVDVATGIQVVNDQWFTFLGYAPGEVPATFALWVSHLHPDDIPAIFQAHEDYLSGRIPRYDIEHRVITRSGEVRWHRSGGKVVARAADGTALRLVGTNEDITDRVRERERIAEALNILELATGAAEIGIWSWDIRTGKLEWDERICDWYELSEAARRSGLYYDFWKSQVHPDDLGRSEAKLQESIRQRTPFDDVFRIRLPGGRVRYIHAVAVMEQDAQGQPQRMLGVNRDVTAQHEQEETLRAAKQAAEAASAAKSEFLAHMSHEIRTPMNVVLGLTQVLEKTPLAPDQHDMVAQIGTAGRSLLGILNDILDLSKIEAGQLQIDTAPFTLAPLLARIESLMGTAARGKGVALTIGALPAAVGGLVGDPLRLEQVLVNLIGNAIKFTDQGEVQVQIEALEATAAYTRLRFTVSDTGIGIPPENLASLFNPFTQADASITRRFGGTGLGLSICKRLVELMGGTIQAASTPGVGSTFRFELRLARTATEVLPTPDLRAPNRVGPRLAGRQILVVDDSAMNREVVTRMLTLEGARTTQATDGQQALDLLRALPRGFDAVLMDVQMPVMDGLSATRSIRDELGLSELPIIALTAGVLPEQQAAAQAAGVDAVLAKPLDLEQMTALLSQWLRPTAPATPAQTVVAGHSPPPVLVSDSAIEFPDIPGIDRDHAVRTLGNDRAFYLHLLQRFADEFATAAELTRHDLAAGERHAATRRMHSLRGTAGYLGALDLMVSAGALEEAMASGAAVPEARIAALGDQLTALIAASAPWRASAEGSETPSAPTLATVSPVDPAQLQALREALRLQKASARRLFNELEPTLDGVLDPESMRSIGDAIRDLRFQAALTALNGMNLILLCYLSQGYDCKYVFDMEKYPLFKIESV